MRPFRFGVSIRTASSRREWREKARRAEAMGFDVLLVADHLDDAFPPLAALGTAAETAASNSASTSPPLWGDVNALHFLF